MYSPNLEDYSNMSNDLFNLWEEIKDVIIEDERLVKLRNHEELQNTPEQFEQSFIDGLKLVLKKYKKQTARIGTILGNVR